MTKRVIAHVDMDCFFAACEIKQNPSLRGKPLVVGGLPSTPRGVVSTASYEARKFGIHSAMPISRAVQLCPHATFVQSTKGLYSKESKRIMSILESFTHQCQQVSVDEAYLDITDLAQKEGSWMAAAKLIRKTIFEQTGFTCSVGVAQSRKVAKIASDYKKPHGVTVVYNMKRFLAPLPVSSISGVGKKSVPYYNKVGIMTIGDLANKSKFFVMDHFGMNGFALWKLANGYDYSQIREYDVEKSISRETTFERDVYERQSIMLHLQKLAEVVYERSKEFLFKTVTLKVRYKDFHTITRSHSFSVSTTSYQQVLSALQQSVSDIEYGRGVRLVGVKLENLSKIAQQQLCLADF